MPTYVYRYTINGEARYVERRFSMRERPEEILVLEDGVAYPATHVIRAPGIQGVTNREEHRTHPSDLPPPDWTPPTP